MGYPFSDIRLVKRCLQRTASSAFGSLDTYSKTEFILNRLKEAVGCDGMASHLALKKAIITSNLAMPEFVEVVTNIVEVWPLIVSYHKYTGWMND